MIKSVNNHKISQMLLLAKINFSIISNNKDFFVCRQHPLSQTSIATVEPYIIPKGNYSYLSYSEQKNKFEMYVYFLKMRMYFCQKRHPYNKNFNSNVDRLLLELTKTKFLKLNLFLKLDNLPVLILTKYLLFYFSFTLTDNWYQQPKILKYIKRLYFFETGYRYPKSGIPVYLLKNIYSHALFNNLLRNISLEKKQNIDLELCIHPFLDILKNVLYLEKKSSKIPSNLTIVCNFFASVISSGFLKDNQVFLKEFEAEILGIIKEDFNKELKKKEKKVEIFLINYFISDFFDFLQKKDIHKYMHYEKKIFSSRIEPHSFFFIPKQGGVV